LSLRAEYDTWHQRVFESAPEHEDASSPWYELVRERIGPVQGLRVLEVACGRGGFVRELARAGARVTGCDFSLAALRVGQPKLRSMNGTASAALAQGDAQSLPFAIRNYVRRAGWKIIHSDGTVHQLPIFPGHNPVLLPSLESNRTVRKMLSPFAYHYFLISEKRVSA
jgi:SAM-dependent methyltransferase